MTFLVLNVVLSAILTYLSFPNRWTFDGLGFLAWVALVPLFWALDGRSIRSRLLIGCAHGLLLYALLLQWLLPVHTAGALLFILTMATQSVFFSAFYLSQDKKFLSVLYSPALWVMSEWARTVFLGGFTWGLAYSQSFYPVLIQTASIAGPSAVSFAVVVVNVLLYRSIRFHDQGFRFTLCAICVVMVLGFFGLWRFSTDVGQRPRYLIGVIQPNISPLKKLSLKDFDDNIRSLEELTGGVARGPKKPEIIVWPETAFPADIFRDRVWYPRLQRIAASHQATFVFGAAPVVQGRNYNSAVVLDGTGALTGVYDKQFLVPFSEYKPSGGIFELFKPLVGNYGFDFSAGRSAKVFLHGKGRTRFATMICSETCYPALTRKFSGQDADFLITILNDGWFKRPEAIMMHAQNAVFRAVESGRSVVSVGNTGWTGVIDAYGAIREQLPLERRSFGIFHVSPRVTPTFYSKFGDFFAGACGLFVIMHLILNGRTRQRS